MTNIYSMSETGSSSRVLAAQKLGYEATPNTPDDLENLQYYTDCEMLSEQIMKREGYAVQGSELCETCLKRGVERHGIHVEIEQPLFKLVGHLDRRLQLTNGSWVPVEIKSLGKNSWNEFGKRQFDVYPEYAYQECCYLTAEKSPGIYWVLNRDTGRTLRYIVNDVDNLINPSTLKHFEKYSKITLPVTFEQVVDKLNLVEIAVASKELPDCEGGNCSWCRFGYLCERDPKVPSKEITLPTLIDAANSYRKSREYSVLADELKENATKVFLDYAVNTKTDKFKANGVSFSYRGMTTKTTLDLTIIRAEAPPELITKATKISAPYPDFSIRALKEE